MNKSEFKKQLAAKLNRLPKSEIEKTLDYYDEIICDRMEDGMSEEEAVAAIGSIEEIAESVMYDQPLQKLIKASVVNQKEKSGGSLLWVILLIVGSPLWISLAAAFFCVVLSAYIVIWVMAAVVYILLASLALAGICSLAAFVMSLSMYSVPVAICILGMGMACAGLALMLWKSSGYILRAALKLSSGGIRLIKSIFISVK